jgi:hypothetical protein
MAPAFNPRVYEVKNWWFQAFAFKWVNLCRYTLVLVDPAGEVSKIYGAIGAKVVQEVAKLGAGPKGGLAVRLALRLALFTFILQ